MSVGLYGNKALASVSSSDVDILFSYSPNRESSNASDTQFSPLFSSITDNELKKFLGADGAYKLRLPAAIFNKLGFYLILIKPKSFQTQIIDCSFVVTNNDNEIQISKKGIVIPKLQFQSTGSLIGYQIEYFDDNGVKIKNFHRIVTSSDIVSVSPSKIGSNQSSTSYILDPNGSFLFLTLTPDEASLVTNEQKVDLGKKGQTIIISNTFFDPTLLEVEMVDQTIKTLSHALYGNSSKDEGSGIFNIFDSEGVIYKSYSLLQRKSQFNNAIISTKEERTEINLSTTFQSVTQGL